MAEPCPQCGKAVKPPKAPTLPGIKLVKPKLCGTCGTLIYVRKLLRDIPTAHDDRWKDMTIWQRNFVGQIEERVNAGQWVSKRQIETVKEIRERFKGA